MYTADNFDVSHKKLLGGASSADDYHMMAGEEEEEEEAETVGQSRVGAAPTRPLIGRRRRPPVHALQFRDWN